MDVLTENEVEQLIGSLKESKGNVSSLRIDREEYAKSTEVVESGIQEAVKNAYDHKIMLFQLIRKGANEPIRYHFHFLLTRKHGKFVAICLDTDDTVPLSGQTPSRQELIEVVNAVLEAFIARACLIDSQDDWIEQKLYFRRADQRLWDKFNEIKERAFVNYAKSAITQEKLEVAGIKDESEVDFNERNSA